MLKSLGVAMVVIGLASADSDSILPPIIMIAVGIGVFVGFNIEWYTIEQDTAKAFRETGFSDYRILSEMGCNHFQGYYFSKPIPVDEFEKLA